MMQARGIKTRLLTAAGANPVVYGELATPGATRSIVFYAHYDGQPVNEGEWSSPPFAPVLRSKLVQDGGSIIPLPAAGTPFDPESRLYGRSAGDDKVPIMAILSALDSLRAAGIATRSTLRFVFEGEEEAGSANLERILTDNKALVTGAVWLLCDSPTHPSRRQQIVFGAPGRMLFDLTVYGANVELHGGHYGNWAPNPAFMLARLLASMRDDNGHVLIPHFYDDVEPLNATERRALSEVPDVDAQLMAEFGAGSRIGKPMSLAELVTLPVLNLRGLLSAHVGANAATIVPASATASMSFGPVTWTTTRHSIESDNTFRRRATSSPTPNRRSKREWLTRRSPC
jgi:acetylornithine deacetylase/succinyl-diaminopimelate desuccinylase-like protein